MLYINLGFHPLILFYLNFSLPIFLYLFQKNFEFYLLINQTKHGAHPFNLLHQGFISYFLQKISFLTLYRFRFGVQYFMMSIFLQFFSIKF